MNGKELRESLEISPTKLRSFLAAGMPHVRAGRGYEFDARRVEAWLIETGRAKKRTLAQSATDVAVHFGVDVRTVHNWKTKRDFPVGPPYDLDAITQWNRSRGQSTGQDEDDAAARRTEAQAKLLELKLQKASGELLDYENVRRLLVRHITEAGTIFDQIPLRVVALLPNECPIESEWPSIRAQVRKNAEQIVSSARQVLADMLAAKEMVKPEEPPACSN